MSEIWAKQSPDDLLDPTGEDITCLIMEKKKNSKQGTAYL